MSGGGESDSLCDYRPCFCSFFVGIGRISTRLSRQCRTELKNRIRVVFDSNSGKRPNKNHQQKRSRACADMNDPFSFLCQCCNGGFCYAHGQALATDCTKLTHLLANYFVATVNIRLYRHEIHFVYANPWFRVWIQFLYSILPGLRWKYMLVLPHSANTYTSQIVENKRDKSDTILCLAIVNIDLSVLSL